MGYVKRVQSSFVGLFIGILMIPGAMVLHAWNEYRTIHRSKGLLEAKTECRPIENTDAVDNSLNGKLVFLHGVAKTEEVLRDPDFNVLENAIHLRRVVEMYQWEEEKDTERRGNERVTTYSYRQIWSANHINSRNFHDQSGHENPTKKIPDVNLTASQVQIGAYQLSSQQLGEIHNYEPIRVSGDALLENIPAEQRHLYVFASEMLYHGEYTPVPDRPQIGDLRIRFEKVPSNQHVSATAKLQGNTFAAFTTTNGESIQRLYVGDFTQEQVFAKLETENTIWAWVLRAAGGLLSVIGFSLVLSPLSALTSGIPFLGRVTGGLVFGIALLLGIATSLFVIAISWIAVRPLLGIGLLIAASVAIYLIFRSRRGEETSGVQYPATVPPPLPPSL